MNISKQTIEILDSLYYYSFSDDFCNVVDAKNATELRIGFTKDSEAQYIGKSIKATKKETTIEYIQTKINADKVYINFSEHFNSIVKKFNVSAYPTTYGIGIFVGFGFRDAIDSIKQKIENVLTELGVKYSTEYSDARWVFRYKISKSIDNIEQIKRICN